MRVDEAYGEQLVCKTRRRKRDVLEFSLAKNACTVLAFPSKFSPKSSKFGLKLVKNGPQSGKSANVIFYPQKESKNEPNLFLEGPFWDPIWEPKSPKMRKNASQKASKFEAFFKGRPEQYFWQILGPRRSKLGQKLTFFEPKSVEKLIPKLCVVSLRFSSLF